MLMMCTLMSACLVSLCCAWRFASTSQHACYQIPSIRQHPPNCKGFSVSFRFPLSPELTVMTENVARSLYAVCYQVHRAMDPLIARLGGWLEPLRRFVVIMPALGRRAQEQSGPRRLLLARSRRCGSRGSQST